MKKYIDMSRKDKRMARMLSLQLIYAKELSGEELNTISSHFVEVVNLQNIKNRVELKAQIEVSREIIDVLLSKDLRRDIKEMQEMPEAKLSKDIYSNKIY